MNITERFLKYVGYGTNSDEKSEACPSTPNQLVLGAAIAEELKALGLTDVEQDADGYVYGYLPGEGEALGLIAHMDTSPAVSGDHIKPRIVTYPGGVLELGASTLSPTDYPFLEEYLGQELIVTDGTTLLGADDKAGVAVPLPSASPPMRRSAAAPTASAWIASLPRKPIPWMAVSWARSSMKTSMPRRRRSRCGGSISTPVVPKTK